MEATGDDRGSAKAADGSLVLRAAYETSGEQPRVDSACSDETPAEGVAGVSATVIVSESDAGGAAPQIYPTVGDRYRVKGILGAGGMGVVYLAERILDGAIVALKLMRKEFATDPTLCARLQREAAAVRRVRHPNVVSLLDEGDAGEHGPFVVFEKLEGESLASRLSSRTCLTAPAALEIMDGALAALEAAHAVGVVHRDLKPENIYLVPCEPNGDIETTAAAVRVLDFGISRLLDDAATSGMDKLTRTGVVIGTPVYMAPEQALAEGTQDHRIDIYSAGVVLYEMLSGTLPHDGDNYNQVLARSLNGDAIPLTFRHATIDTDLAAIVHRAIARDPDMRYATAAEFRTALATWRDDTQVRAERPTEPGDEPGAALAVPAYMPPKRRTPLGGNAMITDRFEAMPRARRVVVRPFDDVQLENAAERPSRIEMIAGRMPGKLTLLAGAALAAVVLAITMTAVPVPAAATQTHRPGEPMVRVGGLINGTHGPTPPTTALRYPVVAAPTLAAVLNTPAASDARAMPVRRRAVRTPARVGSHGWGIFVANPYRHRSP